MMGDPKKIAVGIIAKLKPKDGEGEPSHDTEDHGEVLPALSQEFIHSVHAGDAEGVAEAFRAMFECCDSEPHEEYPHESEEE